MNLTVQSVRAHPPQSNDFNRLLGYRKLRMRLNSNAVRQGCSRTVRSACIGRVGRFEVFGEAVAAPSRERSSVLEHGAEPNNAKIKIAKRARS